VTSPSRIEHRRLIKWIELVLLILVVLAPAALLARPQDPVQPTGDYIAYWAAGRLNATGGDPYKPDEVLALQRSVGWQEHRPRMIWYPPWAMPLLMPFGVLPYPVSRHLWFVFSLGLLLLCTDWLWRTSGGAKSSRWMALLIAVTFVPSVAVLAAGQISVICLLGVLLFLHFVRREQWLAAGAATALIAIKPQLFFLFWIALFLWIIRTRRWAVFGGAVAALAALMAIAWVTNPHVLTQYVYESQANPPDYWITPTIGSILRLAFGWERYWLGLIAPAVGIVWVLVYWRARHSQWCWEKQMPWLLLMSLATAVFAWMFDQVVLLLAVIPALIWLGRVGLTSRSVAAVTVYALINSLAFVTVPLLAPMEQDSGRMLTLADPSRAWGIWLAPVLLCWFYAVCRHLGQTRSTTATEEIASQPESA
jgi:hypothetical protein